MQSNGLEDKQRRDSDHTISRLASIGQISAGIAHEVRNPLTAVKGFIQLLHQEAPHPYLEIASSELDRAISTLQNLLQVSKPDLDDESYVPLKLCSEFESLLYLFQEQIYRVKVEKHLRDTDEIIFGKRNQLKKAFFNLLKNAFEAIPETGVIKIEHYRIGDTIYVSIEDTGTGIPEEKLHLLGTPFFTTKNEGTGMGLTQVYSTLYQHGASIEVKSAVGVGTAFTIKFPVETSREVELVDLKLQNDDKWSLDEFFRLNQDRFDELLQSDIAHVIAYFQQSNYVTTSVFMSLVQRLLYATVNQQHEEVTLLAQERGIKAAKHSLPLPFVLEFFQSYRKHTWDFIYNFYRYRSLEKGEFFRLANRINQTTDSFIKSYILSYTEYKELLMQQQRDIINELAVTVIPLSSSMAVLPIVGTIDTYRAKKIQERVLQKIEELHIEKIVMDVSGVAYIDTAVVGHLFRIVEGIKILGCQTVICGIRPEIANTLMDIGLTISQQIEIKGTLQQALEDTDWKKG